MKKLLFLTGLSVILILASCTKPNAEDILRKSYKRCQSIENGYYEMTHYMKYISKKDTFLNSYQCYFKKLPGDSIYSSAFHYQRFHKDEYIKDVLYTGNYFVTYSKKDSTGRIMSKELWAQDIKDYSHNYEFYSPVTNRKSYPCPDDSAFIDNKHEFDFIGEEVINDIPCNHVKMNVIQEDDSTENWRNIRVEYNFWIDKQEDIPIQYSIAYDVVMNNDTLYQFEKNVLTKYEFNNLKEVQQLTMESVPSYINLIDYSPYKSPELLPKETIAPNWSLVSLNDDTITLSGLKGKLVLIDFFYKSCFPCMLALPALQNLHEKYYNKGLRIIGIDPYDTKEEDEIDIFLSKRGITYTVLLGGKEAAKEYHVSGYPTVYLIGKEGKILAIQVGYGDDAEKELEAIIKQNL